MTTSRRHIVIFLTMLPLALCSCRGGTEAMSVRMAHSEMSRNPSAAYLDGMNGKLKWNYTMGLELYSFVKLSEVYGCDETFRYAKEWVDTVLNVVSATGKKLNYRKTAYVLDHICPGRLCLSLFARTHDERYRDVADTLFSQLLSHPCTRAGAFWHKAVYPHQVWLDGVYMAMPFYTEYVLDFIPEAERGKHFEKIACEFITAADKTFDPVTGLYRHAWDESRSMPWADPRTGQSACAWGRAEGWFAMALVDVLELLPEDAPRRDELVGILKHLAGTLPQWADKESGMWYQVLDHPGQKGNYLESTCSIMFTYMYLKALRLGLLDASLDGYARGLYRHFNDRFVRENADGTVSITSCCSVAGLGGRPERDGSYGYYLSEKVIENDCKAVGPYILASIEMEKYFI